MTKSEELKELAQRALAGDNIDEAAAQFAAKYYSDEAEESDILDVLNYAYIARRFFGKSRFWFSQKINNNIKNGKPADFTENEWQTLRSAFYTISDEIKALADNM